MKKKLMGLLVAVFVLSITATAVKAGELSTWEQVSEWATHFEIPEAYHESMYEVYVLPANELNALYIPFAAMVHAFNEQYNTPFTSHDATDANSRFSMSMQIVTMTPEDFWQMLLEWKDLLMELHYRSIVVDALSEALYSLEQIDDAHNELAAYIINDADYSTIMLLVELLEDGVDMYEMMISPYTLSDVLQLPELMDREYQFEDISPASIALWQTSPRTRVDQPPHIGCHSDVTMRLQSIRSAGLYVQLTSAYVIPHFSDDIFISVSNLRISSHRMSAHMTFNMGFRASPVPGVRWSFDAGFMANGSCGAIG